MTHNQPKQTDWANRVRERIYHTIEKAHNIGRIKGELAHLQMAGSLAADIAASEINILLKDVEDK